MESFAHNVVPLTAGTPRKGDDTNVLVEEPAAVVWENIVISAVQDPRENAGRQAGR